MNRVSASRPLISQVRRSPLRMMMTSLLSRANKGAARNSAPHKTMVLAFIARSSCWAETIPRKALRRDRLDSSTFRTASLADCVRFKAQAARRGRGMAAEAAQASGFWGGFRHDVAGSGGQAGAFQLYGGVFDA